MLKPRVIPCLLIRNKGVVKTINFKNDIYIGDPINTARIFSEKHADELIVLDIDATVKNLEPDYKTIESIANQCRMPLCYGGGIRTVEQALKILSLGVEKVAFSSLFFQQPEVLAEVAKISGKQSVVVVLDIKKNHDGEYKVYINNGTKEIVGTLHSWLEKLSTLDVGEVVINSIDHDGIMQGYDIELVKLVKNYIFVPLTVMGGAGNKIHIQELVDKFGIIGASAGSMFVFKGVHKAVLINYQKPNN